MAHVDQDFCHPDDLGILFLNQSMVNVIESASKLQLSNGAGRFNSMQDILGACAPPFSDSGPIGRSPPPSKLSNDPIEITYSLTDLEEPPLVMKVVHECRQLCLQLIRYFIEQ